MCIYLRCKDRKKTLIVQTKRFFSMFFYTFVGQLAEKVYLCTAFRIESGGLPHLCVMAN